MVVDIDYRKFSNRVCNWREAGFIGISFVVAVGVVGAILLGIYLGTGCPAGETQCKYEGKCIKNDKFCDGVQDCEIGDDEWVCAPTKFYVSFRTKDKRKDNEYLEGLEPHTPKFTAAAERYKIAIEEDFKNSLYSAAFNEAEVFRFRFVDGKGHEYNSTEEGYVTVDSFLKFYGDGRRIKLLHPDNITAIVHRTNGTKLALLEAKIDPRELLPVTTGVAIVLHAPNRTTTEGETEDDVKKKNCRQTTVYCQNYCPGPEDKPENGDFYQHGSTKGCPECMCAKFSGNFPLEK